MRGPVLRQYVPYSIQCMLMCTILTLTSLQSAQAFEERARQTFFYSATWPVDVRTSPKYMLWRIKDAVVPPTSPRSRSLVQCSTAIRIYFCLRSDPSSSFFIILILCLFLYAYKCLIPSVAARRLLRFKGSRHCRSPAQQRCQDHSRQRRRPANSEQERDPARARR